MIFRHGEARRHGMAAAIYQQTGLTCRRHRRADIHVGDRAARGSALSVRHGNDDGRARIALFQPAGDDADDPGMPAHTSGDEDRRRSFAARLDLRQRGVENIRFDGLAFFIELAEMGGDGVCGIAVRGRE